MKSYTGTLIEITGREHSMVELRRMMKERSYWCSMIAYVQMARTRHYISK